MKPHRASDGERSLAVFIDFENMGLGFNNRRDRFEIAKVLERLVEKGKIVAKKAYADWSRFGKYTAALHEAAIELVEIPRRGMSGKNSADIRLVVDAIDLAYSKDHIDTFVIVSGDSDFSPLVSKLKELGKHVIGLGLADATSDLLRDNCDEFIYYEDLDRAPITPVSVNDQIAGEETKGLRAACSIRFSLCAARTRRVIYSSMVKDTIKRKKPSFNEGYYGYRTFSELLEDAQKRGTARAGKAQVQRHVRGDAVRAGVAGREWAAVLRVIQLPARNTGEAKKVVELPKPAAQGEKRPISAGPPARPAAQANPPAESREEEERPLGRALVEDIDSLDEEGLDEAPSYGTKKPAALTSPPAPRKSSIAASEKPAARGKEAAKPAGKSRQSNSRGSRPAKPPTEKPRAPKAESKPMPPTSDDDEFGAGLE